MTPSWAYLLFPALAFAALYLGGKILEMGSSVPSAREAGYTNRLPLPPRNTQQFAALPTFAVCIKGRLCVSEACHGCIWQKCPGEKPNG